MGRSTLCHGGPAARGLRDLQGLICSFSRAQRTPDHLYDQQREGGFRLCFQRKLTLLRGMQHLGESRAHGRLHRSPFKVMRQCDRLPGWIPSPTSQMLHGHFALEAFSPLQSPGDTSAVAHIHLGSFPPHGNTRNLQVLLSSGCLGYLGLMGPLPGEVQTWIFWF